MALTALQVAQQKAQMNVQVRHNAMDWAVKLGTPGETAENTVNRAERFLAFLRGPVDELCKALDESLAESTPKDADESNTRPALN